MEWTAQAYFALKEVNVMYYGKRQLCLTGLAAILAGVFLHFLYHWVPCAGTALVSPICESIWEHGKLIFWPYLAAALLLNRGRPGGIRPWLLVLPLLCLGMLAAGYVWHIFLDGEGLWVDVALYVGLMALGFWLPTRFSGPFQGVRWAAPIVITLLLAALFALVTLWPPEGPLFADLSVASAWYQLPC